MYICTYVCSMYMHAIFRNMIFIGQVMKVLRISMFVFMMPVGNQNDLLYSSVCDGIKLTLYLVHSFSESICTQIIGKFKYLKMYTHV